MTIIHAGFLLCAVLSGSTAQPVCQGELIFPPQPKHCHGSSLVECPNGDLLACWFFGSGERSANDVLIQGARLRKGKTQWSPVFVMADTPNIPDCNPVLFRDDRDRLWLFWIAVVANQWENSLLKYRRAEDYQKDGPPKWSWQDVLVLGPGEDFSKAIADGFQALGYEQGCWAEYAPPYDEMLIEAAKDKYKRLRGWMTRIHPIILPSGRYLLPLYSDGFNLSLTAYSDDHGETWQAAGPIVGIGPTQPSFVLKKNGELVAYMRDEGGLPQRVQKSVSQDQGMTWTPAVDTDIPNPSSSLEVIALKDGRWVMICNDTEEKRHRLVLLMSDDEGATWKWKRYLENGGGAFAYPSMIQTKDGRIHATYSHHTETGNSIKHVALDPEWITKAE